MAGNLTIRERNILREYLERLERQAEILRQQESGTLSFFEAKRQLRAIATATYKKG